MVILLDHFDDTPRSLIDRNANLLATRYPIGVSDDASSHLAANVKHLRDARGLSQAQMARISGLPRATWANLESGAANPTLQVLHKVALALQVSIEELISSPRGGARFYPRGSLPTRTPGPVTVRKLLPDPIPGMAIERMELPPRARLTGVPHIPGSREYLTCEAGEVVLAVAGQQYRLQAGDVVAFRGDQRHSYANEGAEAAIGYSVVVLAPVA
jgi:transcriptional regulator with XRE-family HTH domain